MYEDFTAEFKRRLLHLQRRIEQYNKGEVPAHSIFPALYSCASYCWCNKPLKKVKPLEKVKK